MYGLANYGLSGETKTEKSEMDSYVKQIQELAERELHY